MRQLLNIPDTYAVLFTQGGGTAQFSNVFHNLLAARRLLHSSTPAAEYTPPPVDYIVTGSWSAKAYAEAQRLCAVPNPPAKPRLAATTKPSKFTTLPRKSEYEFSSDAAYVYYCENETINGIAYPGPSEQSSDFAFPFDRLPQGVPLVADYSSSFLSRPIPNLERHAVIYAGAQKNLGPAGTVVVIVRKDLVVDTAQAAALGGVPPTPVHMEYKILMDNASLYNTPPVFAIYVSALVLRHLVKQGGLSVQEEINRKKAQVLYDALDESEKKGLVRCVVREPEARSWMNVTFEIIGEGKEAQFLKGADERGFRQVKGHRSVGGIRASLYNAVGLESVEALCAYIRELQ